MKGRKLISRMIIFTLLISIPLMSFTGCLLYPKEEEILDPPLVEINRVSYHEIAVQKGNIENIIQGSGTVVSTDIENLFFKFKGGILMQIKVKPGDMVKKGDVIAELDTDDLDNQIALQELSCREAEIILDDAKAQLAEDRDNESCAKLAKKAVDAAKEQGISPGQDDVLKAGRLEEFSSTARKSESAALRAEINLERNQLILDNLRLQKQKSTLTSTIDGQVIHAAYINPGDYVPAFKTLAVVADPESVQVQYGGNGMDSFDIGMKVDVNYNGLALQGTVVSNPSSAPADSEDGKRYVQIMVDDLPKNASPGARVDVTLTLGKRENVIVLSKNLIHTSGGRNYVIMLSSGLKVERDVELGLQNATDAEIVRGLSEGEKILN